MKTIPPISEMIILTGVKESKAKKITQAITYSIT